MTLPDERYRAVGWAREFFRSLLVKSETPRVPLEIRRRARAILKHFPWESDMERVAKKLPDIFKWDGE